MREVNKIGHARGEEPQDAKLQNMVEYVALVCFDAVLVSHRARWAYARAYAPGATELCSLAGVTELLQPSLCDRDVAAELVQLSWCR